MVTLAHEELFISILDVVRNNGGFESVMAADEYAGIDVREVDRISHMIRQLARLGGQEDTDCARVCNEADTRKVTAVVTFGPYRLHLRGQAPIARCEVA